MTTTIDLDDLLTTKEAAALLGLKHNTLEIYRHQGKGPPFLKLGDGVSCAVRYQRSALSAWLAQQTFNSTSEHTAAVRAQRVTVKPGSVPAPWTTRIRASSGPRDASE